MKILSDDNGSVVAIFLDKKEGQTMVSLMDAAINNKKLNKQSAAYKLAKTIDDELPVF